MRVTIFGSNIETDALKDVKSIYDLKKKGIFSHLKNEDQACKELLAIIKPVKEPDPPEPKED